ncbi:MAG TPA: hypothetical protein VG984_03005 [Candidatus Paceibacterota bacterium]|nr:hypothetical protein [Candidatus Paceibacterota bacterium]
MHTPPFSGIQVALNNHGQFMFWGAVALVVVVLVFCISLWRRLEAPLRPFFARLKPYAPAISRVSVGLSLVAAAYYDAMFGPELPLSIFGTVAPFIRVALALIGVALTFNLWSRAAAAVMLALFIVQIWLHGSYMLTYVNYLGEILVLVFFVHERLRPYAFVLLRVAFGTALIYASFYAKILHNDLALQVASLPLAGHAHSLAYYFGFEPHFLVLGAAIIELIIGAFFILGIEIRFTCIFMLFWLSLSLFYFGEVVWPHVVLIGIPVAFLCHGYDSFSLQSYFMKRRGRTAW